jgi:hypothetical protein
VEVDFSIYIPRIPLNVRNESFIIITTFQSRKSTERDHKPLLSMLLLNQREVLQNALRIGSGVLDESVFTQRT